MTKKNTFVKRLTRFMLWLIKACIVTSALTGVAVIDRRALKDKETNRD
jgi:hypothetical protein